MPWNQFAKVEAYDQLIEGDQKCVTNIIRIIETYSFKEFVKLIQKELQNNYSNRGDDSNGVNYSDGVNRSYGITKCEGISQAIFCFNKSGKLMAFNTKISEERFNEIYKRLVSFNWSPKFNNAKELKGNLAWYESNIPAIVCVDNKTVWRFIPEEMKDYIQSLPEYNEKLFKKITGDLD